MIIRLLVKSAELAKCSLSKESSSNELSDGPLRPARYRTVVASGSISRPVAAIEFRLEVKPTCQFSSAEWEAPEKTENIIRKYFRFLFIPSS
jgi:hypothetical protein